MTMLLLMLLVAIVTYWALMAFPPGSERPPASRGERNPASHSTDVERWEDDGGFVGRSAP